MIKINFKQLRNIFKINFKSLIKIASGIDIIIHMLSIALGISYFFNPINVLLFDFFGIIFFIAWIFDISLILVNDRMLNKSSLMGKKINHHSYYFIVTFIASLLLMVFGIIFTTFILSGLLAILGQTMVILGFFLTILYGLYYNLLIFSNIKSREVWNLD